jgi:hypothetical protein
MYKDLMGKPEGNRPLEHQRMGSEWILGRLAGKCRVDPVGLVYGPVGGYCEYGDEPSGSGATESVI